MVLLVLSSQTLAILTYDLSELLQTLKLPYHEMDSPVPQAM